MSEQGLRPSKLTPAVFSDKQELDENVDGEPDLAIVNILAKIEALLASCWQDEAKSRPSFKEILTSLEGIKDAWEHTNHKENLAASPEIHKPNKPTEVNMADLKFIAQIPRKSLFLLSGPVPEGTGQSTELWQGEYRSQPVSIKLIHGKLDPKERAMFEAELLIMESARSPYLVMYYGAVLTPMLAIVTAYLPNGSLYDLLEAKEPPRELTWEFVLSLAVSVVSAINILHCWSPSIVHTDVKPTNFLFDENYNIKISNIALARFRTKLNGIEPALENAGAKQQPVSPKKSFSLYSAPEAYSYSEYSTRSDVYGLGIILWELITRYFEKKYRRPFSEYPYLKFDFQVITAVSKKDLRPSVHAKCPQPLAKLINSCWNPIPSERPSASFLLEELQTIKKFSFEIEREHSDSSEEQNKASPSKKRGRSYEPKSSPGRVKKMRK